LLTVQAFAIAALNGIGYSGAHASDHRQMKTAGAPESSRPCNFG
jgi:hypothetical protein